MSDSPKIALIRANVRQAAIARRVHVSESVVSRVVNGTTRSRRVETAIAAATQTSPSDLWPEWYGSKRRSRKPRTSLGQCEAALAALAAAAQEG